MAISATLRDYLARTGLTHEVLTHPRVNHPMQAAQMTCLPAEHFLQTQLLEDRRGLLAVTYPLTHQLDLDALNRQLQRDMQSCAATRSTGVFHDCPAHALPPLSTAYGVRLLVDESLHLDTVYFLGGSETDLLSLSYPDLINDQHPWRARGIIHAASHEHQSPAQATPGQIRQRIQAIEALPAMPQMAQRILQLRANPYAGVEELATIVRLDPSLSAQVIRYARSPFFAYRGRIDSIEQAITRVLGYDMVMHIVIGIALGQSFQHSQSGPLGLQNYWRHSLYCAALCQCLSQAMPQHLRPRPGLAYLTGMLHNIGVLILGHYFSPEFFRINKRMQEQPQQGLMAIEQQLLDMHHTELGMWLAQHWQLPAEVVQATAQHHNPDYDGLYSVFPNLVYLANCLLQPYGLGDAPTSQAPDTVLQRLGLTRQQIEQVMRTVMQGEEGLENLAQQLAA